MRNLSIAVAALLLVLKVATAAECRTYALPYENKRALAAMLHAIDGATSRIDAAIYSFTNKKIAKSLKKAAARGVRVTIIFDVSSNLGNRYSRLGYLAKYKNINAYILHGKPYKKNNFGIMHMKSMVIDRKVVVTGSANWSNSAFSRNYEWLIICNDYAMAKKYLETFNRMKAEAKAY